MASDKDSKEAGEDLFAQIERRHELVLEQIDQLNDRIEATLAELAGE